MKTTTNKRWALVNMRTMCITRRLSTRAQARFHKTSNQRILDTVTQEYVR